MILETKISQFKSTKQIEVEGEITLEELLKKIKSGEWQDEIENLRKGHKDVKTQLPTFSAHGLFKHYRKKDNFIESSGIIILDLDDVEDDLEEVKQDIMDSSDHVLATMVSPSGNGIKVLYYVDPDMVHKDNYREVGREVVSDFEIYGHADFLSITDCLIATYDRNILINEDVIMDRVHIKEVERINGELEPLDSSKVLWDDPEDFFDTVLYNDIAEKTNNNFHFIQVSILDLKKFGFEHPKEDLSFVVDYAEETFKRSSTNKQRFLEAVEVAKNYPQLKWAYRLGREDSDEWEEEESYVDYSEYQSPKKEESKEQVVEDSSEEIEDDGLIEYDNLWQRCLDKIEEGDRVGYEVALKNLADIIRFKGTGIMTVTGIPGHGKTEAIDVVLLDLARLFGLQSLIAGFEQEPEEHIIKLMRKMIGVDIRCESYRGDSNNEEEMASNFNFITKHFKHLDITKVGGDINSILKHSAEIIKKQRDMGEEPTFVVIDPFNMLSIKGSRFSGHEKIEEILRRITHFSHQMGVMVILVAHPFKMKKDEKTGQYEVPDFYSVKGSSAFFEMSYHGLVVYRNPDNSVMIKVLKVKQNNLGERDGVAFFSYQRDSGRYIPIDEDGNELPGDHRERGWLKKTKWGN